MARREDLTSVNLGSAKVIGQRLVAEGRYENLSEAFREGSRRLADDAQVIDRIIILCAEGMASGIDETFAIDCIVSDLPASI